MTRAEAGILREAINELVNRQHYATLSDANFTSYAARDLQRLKLKRQKAKVRQMIAALTTQEAV